MKLKSIFVYFALLTLLFSIIGCGGGEETAVKENTAVSTTNESEADESGGGEETAVTNTTSTSDPTNQENIPASENTSIGDAIFVRPNDTLDSYRMITEIQFISSEELMGSEDPLITEIAWVRNPPAEHTITSGILAESTMETIVIGSQTWTTMGNGTWMESATDEQNSGEMQNFIADLEDMLADIQENMIPAGKENINGVNCQKYEVDANFTFAMPMPEEAEGEEEFFPDDILGHIGGNIWIANESGLPPIVVRSYTTQKMTMQFGEGVDQTFVYEEKRDLIDINKPIMIEPPYEAVTITNPTSGIAEATTNNPDIEIITLDSLDSFRLEWTVLMIMGEDESGMELSNLVEWVREPFAVRVDLGMGGQTMGQFIILDDQAWVQMGGQWMDTTIEDVTSNYENIVDTMQLHNDAIFIGEEVVDNINCLHYIYDDSLGMIHQEWWVANESDLPNIVIKTLYQMNTDGMVTETNGRLFDINTPINIEPPQSYVRYGSWYCILTAYNEQSAMTRSDNVSGNQAKVQFRSPFVARTRC